VCVNIKVLSSSRNGISTLKHGCGANIPARISNVQISNISTQNGCSDTWCSVVFVAPSKQRGGFHITHVPCCLLLYNIYSIVFIIKNVKLLPCCKLCILSFGWFPASEFYVPTFRNTLFHLHRLCGRFFLSTLPMKVQQTVFRNVGT